MIIKIYRLLPIKEMIEQLREKVAPVRVTYKIMKITEAAQKEIKFYEEQINKIIMDCAEKEEDGTIKRTEDGTGTLISLNKRDECQRRVSELDNMDIDFPDILFTLDELEPLGLTFEQIFNFSCFIKEE